LVRDRQTSPIRKEAVGQPVRLANVAHGAAMQFIGARTQQRVERSAAGTGYFGVVGACLQLHFLDRFGRGDKHGAIVRIRDRDTVHQNVIGSHRPAGDRHLGVRVLVLHAAHLRVGDEHDRLCQLGGKERVSPEDRQIGDLLALDELPGGRIGRL
jgi:hypothetical protein